MALRSSAVKAPHFDEDIPCPHSPDSNTSHPRKEACFDFSSKDLQGNRIFEPRNPIVRLAACLSAPLVVDCGSTRGSGTLTISATPSRI